MKRQDDIVVYKLQKIALVSFVFMGVEIAGGYYANSIAILADAFHLFSDVLAYIISLYAVLMTYKTSPKHLTFGYEKLQPFGALLNVVIIWIVTAELFFEATSRLINKSVVQEPTYMLAISVFGLLCNLYIMSVLHSDEHSGHQCSHDHGHAHQINNCSHEIKHHKCSHSQHSQHNHSQNDCIGDKVKQSSGHSCSHHQFHSHHQQSHHGNSCKHHQEKQTNHIGFQQNLTHNHEHKKDCSHEDKAFDDLILCSLNSDEQIKSKDENTRHGGNINIDAAYIHILTDIILSIGVILSAGIIYFCAPNGHVWSYWQLADPICTYLFSIMAIYSTISIAKEAITILLDGCDDPKLVQDIQSQLKSDSAVQQIESLKVWSMNRGKYYGALRVKVKSNNCQHVESIFRSRKMEGYVEIVRPQIVNM